MEGSIQPSPDSAVGDSANGHVQSDVVDQAADASGARRRIGEAATRLFSEKGYNGVSVREIVEAAGVTKPTLYYYYGNKEQLFERLIRESLEEFRHKLDWAVAQPGTVRERLVRTGEVFLDYARQNAHHCRLLYNVYFSSERNVIDFDFDSYYNRTMELIRHAFAEGIASNEIRPGDPGLMAFSFVGAVNLYVTAMLFNPSVLPPEDPTEAIVDTILHGLAKHGDVDHGGQ